MKLPLKSKSTKLPGITGTARLGRRTKTLTKRLRPGDIAIIDHLDIDRAAAVALVEAGVAAVVNVAPSLSGRYPALGARVLVDAGVALVDDVGEEVFTDINDGDIVRVDRDTVYHDDIAVTAGVRQHPESVAASFESSKDGLPTQLEAFSANAVEHLRHERRLLLDGHGVPNVSTPLRGRHVLVVLRNFDYRTDLRRLKTYIKENSPVLVGVDAGADALLGAGHRPDLIVCDGGDISDAALSCGAEIVVRTSHDGSVSGGERIDRLGIRHKTFATNGTTEDAALVLAHAREAELIVLVGSHTTLVEYLDRGRSSMASSFLTRATVGARLVDGKAVAALYRNRVSAWWMFWFMLLAVAVVAAALYTTPVGQDWWEQLRQWGEDWYAWGKDLVT